MAVLLEFYYLFASLPYEFAAQFIDIVFETSKQLNLPPHYKDRIVTKEELVQEFETCRLDLLNETGCDPGDESLALLIANSYPRY